MECPIDIQSAPLESMVNRPPVVYFFDLVGKFRDILNIFLDVTPFALAVSMILRIVAFDRAP